MSSGGFKESALPDQGLHIRGGKGPECASTERKVARNDFVQELEFHDEDSCPHRGPLECHAGNVVCGVPVESEDSLGQFCLEGLKVG